MALIRFETNTSIGEERARIVRQNLGKAVSHITGEPEQEMRVEIAENRRMRMATSDEPIAHVEIRNVEIAKDRARDLTQAVCPVLEDTLAIQDSNIYIAVISKRNSMWRVNGDLK